MPGLTHMGPVAQDFYAAFHLGGSDTTITTVDPDGVALAAIQGLNQKLEETRAELRRKEAENAEMETRLAGQEIAFEADDDEESYAPAQYLADSAAEPYAVLEAKQSEEGRAAGLEQALGNLDPRSRRIIEARWLREKDAATLHDLAAEFKVSAERIRQIEAKALQQMRKALPAPAAA